MGKLQESNRGKLLEKPLGSHPRYTLYFVARILPSQWIENRAGIVGNCFHVKFVTKLGNRLPFN